MLSSSSGASFGAENRVHFSARCAKRWRRQAPALVPAPPARRRRAFLPIGGVLGEILYRWLREELSVLVLGVTPPSAPAE
jgi:hypothetical protein